VISYIRCTAGQGQVTVLLALDISAAFDAVDHAILCDRSRSDFGIDGAALHWLRSFVVGRTQNVAVGTARSTITTRLSGVPQGSILGPLLFSIYVTPVADVIGGHDMHYHHQYADDLQMYVSLRPNDFSDRSTISQCVSDVSRWFVENALLLNPEKTEAVVFGTRQRLATVDQACGLDVCGVTVPFSDAIKLLGVTLDSSLTFDRHVVEIVRSCNYHIRALRHIRPMLTTDAAKSVALSIVGARLDYCNSLLYGTSQLNIQRLQKMQNSLARAVCQAPWSTSATDLRRTLVAACERTNSLQDGHYNVQGQTPHS